MKKTSKIMFCLALAFLLAACGPSAAPASGTPVDVAAIQTAAVSTARVQLTETQRTASPAPQSTPTRTPIPIPTQVPSIEPADAPGRLSAALAFELQAPFNRHAIRKITGWAYGFHSFRWLKPDQLELQAVIGPQPLEGEIPVATYPAFLDLSSGKISAPASADISSWTTSDGKMIVSKPSASGGLIEIQDAHGHPIKSYTGNLLSVSPSGDRILLKSGVWIDLTSGKIVDFGWKPDSIDDQLSHPVWSADEKRIFSCCDLYADAASGESSGVADLDVIFPHGAWLANGAYFLPDCCANRSIGPGFVPLFDWSTKAFLDLNVRAGISPDQFDSEINRCNKWNTSPNARYVWAQCFEGNYLVDLGTFTSQAFHDYPYLSIEDVQWSGDGNFAWLQMDPDLKVPDQILSAPGRQLKPVPHQTSCRWHPAQDVLACLPYDGENLSVLDARSASVLQVLPLSSPIQDAIWSPDGRHLALLARDSSVWQIDYPGLKNLEQMTAAWPALSRPVIDTPSMRESLIGNLAWSPDGAALGFIGGADIYILDNR